MHRDSCDSKSLTALVYPNPDWAPELGGETTFYDERGGEVTLGQYEGINIPKGAFYRYLNTGDRNLFLLRFGCKLSSESPQESRLKPDGSAIPGHTAENHHIDGVPIPGKFFGAK